LKGGEKIWGKKEEEGILEAKLLCCELVYSFGGQFYRLYHYLKKKPISIFSYFKELDKVLLPVLHAMTGQVIKLKGYLRTSSMT
jgi:hypothetical protein